MSFGLYRVLILSDSYRLSLPALSVCVCVCAGAVGWVRFFRAFSSVVRQMPG